MHDGSSAQQNMSPGPGNSAPSIEQLRGMAARQQHQVKIVFSHFFSWFFFIDFLQRLRCSSSSWSPRSRGWSISSSKSTSIIRWLQSTTDSGGQWLSLSHFLSKHFWRDCCLTREFIAKSSSDTKRIMLIFSNGDGDELRKQYMRFS